jgi:type 1 glutamine amidotransferase
MRRLGARAAFAVDATDDPSGFTPANLARYRAVVFLLTTGDVLGPAQQTALEHYVRSGGGWVGIHSAADTEYGWPFYGELVSARFRRHPPPQHAFVDVLDRSHPSTRDLPARWGRVDEWYDFRTQPRAHLLLAVEEHTYSGGGMGPNHPIAWCHPVGAGRAWYTAMGHSVEAYSDPLFLRHVLGGVLWVAGLVPGNCR